MQTLILLLAVAGALAIVRGLGRTLLRLGLRAAEETTASGLAEVSARRGDITGLSERRQVAQAARRERRRDLAQVILWLAWLAIPPIAGWVPEAYALAAPLWLVAPPRVGAGRGLKRWGGGKVNR